jgi:hypothetical protein
MAVEEVGRGLEAMPSLFGGLTDLEIAQHF